MKNHVFYHFFRMNLLGFAVLTWVLGSCVTVDPKEDLSEEEHTKISLAINYLNQGNPKHAFTEIRPILREKPNNPILLNLMGLCFLAEKKPKNASKYFKQAYERMQNPAFKLNLTSAYIAAGQLNGAIPLLKEMQKDSLKTYAYPERIFYNLGLIYQKKKDFKRAESYFDQALTINPNHYMSSLQLSKTLFLLNRPNEERMEATISMCGTCFEPISLLARFYVKQRKVGEASRLVAKYLAKENLREVDRQEAKKIVAYLDRASAKKK